MEISYLIDKFAGERDGEIRGIFASISILQNRLQTIFDKTDELLTLKQFMLLVMIKNSNGKTTLTHLGKLLGSSRQNIKKLAISLEQKGFLVISHEEGNKKNTSLVLTDKANSYSEKVFSSHTEKLESIFSDYSDEEIHMFYGLIVKLYGGVEREELN